MTQPPYWAVTQDWTTGAFEQTDNHHVGASYFEAEAFCNWAGVHLPTEAQWENAARWTGSHANVYPWGDEWYPENSNNMWDHNEAGGGYEHWQTAPVGSYPDGASPYGCQDMAGNLAEWCSDWFSGAYYSESPTIDPQGPAESEYVLDRYRVVRGGNFAYPDHRYNRMAVRSKEYPVAFSNTGFRVVR